MKISIITATYNSENSIEKCIQSIISQTYKNIEHIIVDNLSKDRTVEIINNAYSQNNINLKLRIISEKDNGISDAFNKGIKAASGDIISILNSDDYYFDPNVLEKVINVFKNTNILFTHGDIKFIDPIYGTNIRRPLVAKMMKGMLYNHPTMFVKKELYDKVGTFNEAYKYSMDFEFYCRIVKNFDPDKISVYIQSNPIVCMSSGGASWNDELLSVEEIKKALIQHKFWNKEGKKFFKKRKRNTILKRFLSDLRLFKVIKIWRIIKWN